MDQAAVYRIIEDHYRENFKDLVKRYSGAANCAADAQDIVQDGYTWCLENWERYAKIAHRLEFHKWLHGSLLHALRDFKKAEQNIGMVVTTEETS